MSKTSITARLVALLTVAGITSFASPTRADAGYVVLCNSSNPISALSPADLKKALTGGTKQWANGVVVQVGVSAVDSPDLRYLAGVVGMSSADLLSRIQQQVFKGEMRRPVLLHSTAECVGLARMNPGALCVAESGMPLPPEAKIVGIQ